MTAIRTFLPGLAATGLAIGLCGPADATLQLAFDVNGINFDCVDNTACDSNPAVGTIQLANENFAGVQVNGSVQQSVGTPANPGLNFLNTSSLSIINTNAVSITGTFAVSDTSFKGPSRQAVSSGSGTWQDGPAGQDVTGSTITLKWFDDPANTQGANNPNDTPGNLVGIFSNTATGPGDSFAKTIHTAVNDTGPFSMTLWGQATIMPGAELISRGQTEIKRTAAIPEPSTWAMMLLGFAGLGFLGYRRTVKAPVAA